MSYLVVAHANVVADRVVVVGGEGMVEDEVLGRRTHDDPVAPGGTPRAHVVVRQRRLLFVRVRRRKRNRILDEHLLQWLQLAVELLQLKRTIELHFTTRVMRALREHPPKIP